MKSDYDPQFINNIFLLKSSLYTSSETERENQKNDSKSNLKGTQRQEKRRSLRERNGLKSMGLINAGPYRLTRY